MRHSLFISNDNCLIRDVSGNPVDFRDNVGVIKQEIPTIGDDLVLRESTICGSGCGLFANRVFEKGEIVTYYHGAISKRVPVKDLAPLYKTHARRINGYYVMYGNFTENGELINLRGGDDTRQVDNLGGGAFINAKSAVESNCDWYILRSRHNESTYDEREDPFQIVILIYANRKIDAQEEFFIDYGQDYWMYDPSTSLGTTEPVFITRDEYYRPQQVTKRVLTRISPTLVHQGK